MPTRTRERVTSAGKLAPSDRGQRLVSRFGRVGSAATNEAVQRDPQRLLPTNSKVLFGGGVHVRNEAVLIRDQDRIVGVFQYRALPRLALAELFRALHDDLLGPGLDLFKQRLTNGDRFHLPHPGEARGDNEDVLEDHPCGVLQQSPRIEDGFSVNRLRKVIAPDRVIGDHGEGRREEDPVVPVEGEERKGNENVEVRLDPSAREVDDQARHQHLADRHHDSIAEPALSEPKHGPNGGRDEEAQPHRLVHVRMNGARRPRKRARRKRQGAQNDRQILDRHDDGEDPVRTLRQPLPLQLHQFVAARHDAGRQRQVEGYDTQSFSPFKAQPNTGRTASTALPAKKSRSRS